jgi:hypothetical protein
LIARIAFERNVNFESVIIRIIFRYFLVLPKKIARIIRWNSKISSEKMLFWEYLCCWSEFQFGFIKKQTNLFEVYYYWRPRKISVLFKLTDLDNKCLKMAQNDRQWPKKDRKWSKKTKNDRKRQKMFENYLVVHRSSQNVCRTSP